MNMNAYKNIGGYISKIQVESYFNRNTVSVEKRWYMYWCVQRKYKKICLLTSANRGAL
jgi:hypothetical protein